MGYVSTWPNAKVIGKKSTYEDETKSIELPELKVEKSVEEGAVMPTESKPSENDQTTSKEWVTVIQPDYRCFFTIILFL